MAAEDWLCRFRQAHRQLSAPDRAEALWLLASDPALVTQWLRAQLQEMAGDPARLPAGYADPVLQSLVLLDDGELHLSLAFVDAVRWNERHAKADGGGDVIEFADGWTRVRVLHATGATVQMHARSDRGEWRADRPKRLCQGQEFVLDNARQALRFCSVSHDIVLLRLLVRDPDLRHVVECEAATGQVLRRRQAQSHDARVQMMLSLLRSLGRTGAIDVIAASIGAWPPELRWHGVCEALALDAFSGFALLEAMAREDADPDLRALAQQTRSQRVVAHPQVAERV